MTTDNRELVEALRAVCTRLDRITGSGGNASAVNNNGSAPAWIAAILAAIAATCAVFVVLDNVKQEQHIARTQDYLNQLWQKYPELRPENLGKQK